MSRVLIVALLAGCSQPATLTEVQDQVFTPSCAFSSCHGGGAGQLDLTEGHARDALVGVAVVGADRPDHLNENVDVSGEIRVIAGDSADSYLYKKCAGSDGIKGSPMPDGTPGVDADKLALIASWIDDGAQNN